MNASLLRLVRRLWALFYWGVFAATMIFWLSVGLEWGIFQIKNCILP